MAKDSLAWAQGGKEFQRGWARILTCGLLT